MNLRRIRIGGLAVVAAILLASCAGPGNAVQPVHVLSVTGVGHVEAAPDTAIITLGIETRQADLAGAVRENSLQASKVMDAITSAGVAQTDIQTTAYHVAQLTMFDNLGNPTNEVQYQVDNTLQVKLRDLSGLGDLLESVVSQGANVVQGVSYTVDDPTAWIDQARQAAMLSAKQQAITLASTAGVELGSINGLSENAAIPSPVYYAPSIGKGGGGGGDVSLSPGTLSFDVMIFVTYQLR
jgi:uncharacterized protein YggE